MGEFFRPYIGSAVKVGLSILLGLANGVLEFLLALVIAFFFYASGERIAGVLRALLERIAGAAQAVRLISVTGATMRGVVYGLLGTAIVQGVLTTLGLWAAGVPRPLLLGVIAGSLSVLPIGAPLVWIPAALWLLADAHHWRGILLFAYGLVFISGSDNVIRPYFIARGARLPFLLTMLGVLGGALAFGLLGIFVGPVLLSIGYTLVQEFAAEEQPLSAPDPARPAPQGVTGAPGRAAYGGMMGWAIWRATMWRVGQLAPTLLVVSVLAFAVGTTLGDPVGALLGPDADSSLHAATARALGLDRPLLDRYLGFVGAAMHGDLGNSWRAGRPVRDLLSERLPASFELAGVAGIVALSLGVPAGVLTAAKPEAIVSRVAGGLGLLAASVPPFLLGLLLIELFAVQARLLPAFGRGTVVILGGWSTGLLTPSGRRALVLPALTLGLFQAAVLLRVTRAEVRRALASRPVRFARARGLPSDAVLRQALRQARVPLVTVLAPQLAGLLAFAVVTESVFGWPGLGALLIQAVTTADMPVVAACLLLAGLVFALSSLAADLAVMAFDPRLRIATR